jgi:thioesterase domain-containing protein
LRGFGASESLPENYAIKDYADDVADLIRALEIENYALIGHSMGGKIALALAARRPKGLRSLILLAPSPPTPEPIKEETRGKLLASHGNRCVATDTVCKAAGGKLSGESFRAGEKTTIANRQCRRGNGGSKPQREDISAEMEKINVRYVAAGETGRSDGHRNF